MPFNTFSASSSVISSPSTLTFNPLFLASVIILSISLNLFSLTFTHFGNFNLSDFVLIMSSNSNCF